MLIFFLLLLFFQKTFRFSFVRSFLEKGFESGGEMKMGITSCTYSRHFLSLKYGHKETASCYAGMSLD